MAGKWRKYFTKKDIEQHARNSHEKKVEESYIDCLSDELLMLIFNFLPPNDLLKAVPQVSQRWNNITKDSKFWKTLIKHDQKRWNMIRKNEIVDGLEFPFESYQMKRTIESFGECSINESNAAIEDPLKWRALYLLQHEINQEKRDAESILKKITTKANDSTPTFTPARRRPHHALHRLTGEWNFRMPLLVRNPIRRRPFRIPIIGKGKHLNARRFLYRMMWASESPFRIFNLHPGAQGFGSGVGFKVNDRELSLAAFPDTDVTDDLVPEWKSYFDLADAIIFMCDARCTHSSVSYAKLLLERFIDGGKCPVLILAMTYNSDLRNDQIGNNSDSDSSASEDEETDETTGNRKDMGKLSCSKKYFSVLEMVKVMNLEKRLNGRRWCVKMVQNNSMIDVYKGVEWLSLDLVY